MAFGADTINAGGNAVSDIFGAFGSFESAKGSKIAAQDYTEAAGIAANNAELEGFATKIKQTQEEREAFKTIGSQVADVAGAGFEESGSALDLLRSSASQGALAKQLIGEQGAIQQNTFEEQSIAYQSMAASASAKAKADTLGGYGKIAGALFSGATAIATL